MQPFPPGKCYLTNIEIPKIHDSHFNCSTWRERSYTVRFALIYFSAFLVSPWLWAKGKKCWETELSTKTSQHIIYLNYIRAAGGNNVEIMNYLLDKGAPVDQTDKSGRTALHWAVISGHKEATDILLGKVINTELELWVIGAWIRWHSANTAWRSWLPLTWKKHCAIPATKYALILLW